jgi:type I restriction enzyme S subunit
MSEFKEVSIGEVCSVGDGAHSKVKRVDEGVPYLTSKNIGQGILKLDKFDFISEESFQKLFPAESKATRKPQVGDVLFGIIGTFGNVYLYKEGDHFGFSSSIGILRPNPKKLDCEYLYYVVSSSLFKSNHASHNAGSVQGYTNISTVKSLRLPLPPLVIQKNIAKILKALDEKIQINRQINQTLESMAQAIFQSWFVDFDPVKAKITAREQWQTLSDGERREWLNEMINKQAFLKTCLSELTANGEQSASETLYLNIAAMTAISSRDETSLADMSTDEFAQLYKTASIFPERLVESELGEIPEGWEVSHLDKFINFANGKSIKTCEMGEFPVYGANGIVGKSDKFKFFNSVIVGRVGAYCGSVFHSLGKFWASDNTIIANQKYDGVELPYIFYQLQFLNLNQYAGGAAQPLLNQNTLKSIKVVFSKKSLVYKYCNLVEGFLVVSGSNIYENNYLEKVRDSLLPKLLSGELAITNKVENLGGLFDRL